MGKHLLLSDISGHLVTMARSGEMVRGDRAIRILSHYTTTGREDPMRDAIGSCASHGDTPSIQSVLLGIRDGI